MVYFFSKALVNAQMRLANTTYQIVSEDELIEGFDVMSRGEADIFSGYTLQQIQGIPQNQMLGEMRSA